LDDSEKGLSLKSAGAVSHMIVQKDIATVVQFREARRIAVNAEKKWRGTQPLLRKVGANELEEIIPRTHFAHLPSRLQPS
jgi:hypothetical protein